MLENILNLEGISVINKEQQKMVLGGRITPGTCAWQGGNGYSGVSGVNKDYAEGASQANGGYWCCDSCCSVSWLSDSHKGYLGCAGYAEFTEA